MSAVVRIGCPGWAYPPWVGTFFTSDARREDLLRQYATVFATAEGNTSFYALPTAESIRRWAAEAPADFRFCFKFPRTISHDKRLVDAAAETREFLERVAPLGGRLGAFFLQVHHSFDRKELPALAAYLRSLPAEHRYAVEVRHADFFDHGEGEHALDDLLASLGVERVNFDTRGLFAARPEHEAIRVAQGRKPRLAFRATALTPEPFVRFVGDLNVENDRALLAGWAHCFAKWIAEGRRPSFFAHHPDDLHAPAVGRLFQQLLHERCPQVPPPPAWPIERERAERGEQLGLF
jgi:uncharacterized protein YecE (DUF72 family)